MTYETKTTTRRQNLREALVAAAERTIATGGLRGLKARDLAAEAGCAVGAIYNVVADLDDLILAVNALTLAALERALTEAGGAIDSESRDEKEAIRRLVRLGLAYTDFAAANTQRWRALFDHRMAEGRDLPEWYVADQRRLFEFVEQPLTMLRPDETPEARALLARSLFSAVHGIVALGLEEKLQLIPLPVLREQVTTLVEAMGKGLAHAAK
ncbi:MAG: TetR/AcrR family transcriptional regulator [Xanthobacteraceae bacterium]